MAKKRGTEMSKNEFMALMVAIAIAIIGLYAMLNGQ